ncbi:metallophosphoesterase family protein [Pollutimonas bauzanensis]|uniref:Diadenosine tetraphosphatase ApaH/serine/threonine protein phosphatase, PP2A family n=1 Tax=Pollutimonas bauzanensis TaxID=658167 RepID=A0A1M5LZ99_9BURK|nr:metallophosphoesterase [Pollutimonas bauzanensis]SHG70422.1 Diadenosine tetraphosphatase ApaH/serine/threonine protein phosphatase, PP2A family [Pollutimonas bauzanensis]
MKTALLSDIHSNWQAFQACLAHARGQGAQRIALLGDLVGYGADPAAVVEQAMMLAGQGAALVMGNHDRYAIDPPLTARNMGEQSARWTHDQLSPAQRSFLASLPLTAPLGGNALLVHASADNPEQWHYVRDTVAAERSLNAAGQDDPAIRYVFSGHVHEQLLYFLTPTGKLMSFSPQPGVAVPLPAHRQWLAIVGSVGQPRDGDPRAMYALFDDDTLHLTFHRVPYDYAQTAAAILAAGLPAFFADRLEHGR